MDIKDRFKKTESNRSSDDLFKLWDEQRKTDTDQAKIHNEIKSNKARQKELKKQLRSYYQEDPSELSVQLKKIVKKFQHIHSDMKLRLRALHTHKKIAATAMIVIVCSLSAFYFIFNKGPASDSQPQSLGSSSSVPAFDLPKETPKEFDLLYKNGTSEGYEVVRISPPNAAASYTYLDKDDLSGTVFRVTQQEVPPAFDLSKVATDFKATDVIEIDGQRIYHGYAEKGTTQSLLFIKNSILFTIRSPQRLTDEVWASYYTSLR